MLGLVHLSKWKEQPMTEQLSFELPKHNGNGGHGRRERDFAADLRHWLADLDAAEALRREQLRQCAGLRSEIYRHAKTRGVTASMLNATRQLLTPKAR
jgi:hypothetical protein